MGTIKDILTDSTIKGTLNDSKLNGSKYKLLKALGMAVMSILILTSCNKAYKQEEISTHPNKVNAQKINIFENSTASLKEKLKDFKEVYKGFELNDYTDDPFSQDKYVYTTDTLLVSNEDEDLKVYLREDKYKNKDVLSVAKAVYKDKPYGDLTEEEKVKVDGILNNLYTTLGLDKEEIITSETDEDISISRNNNTILMNKPTNTRKPTDIDLDTQVVSNIYKEKTKSGQFEINTIRGILNSIKEKLLEDGTVTNITNMSGISYDMHTVSDLILNNSIAEGNVEIPRYLNTPEEFNLAWNSNKLKYGSIYFDYRFKPDSELLNKRYGLSNDNKLGIEDFLISKEYAEEDYKVDDIFKSAIPVINKIARYSVQGDINKVQESLVQDKIIEGSDSITYKTGLYINDGRGKTYLILEKFEHDGKVYVEVYTDRDKDFKFYYLD